VSQIASFSVAEDAIGKAINDLAPAERERH
jgi:hypothetical protein